MKTTHKRDKAKARERKIKKQRNIVQNLPAKRYRLDVLLDGVWRTGVKEWHYSRQVEAHKAETEDRRQKGEDIAPGRVVDLEKGKVILEIAGSKPKGAAPDKIDLGVKAADFEVKVESGPLGHV